MMSVLVTSRFFDAQEIWIIANALQADPDAVAAKILRIAEWFAVHGTAKCMADIRLVEFLDNRGGATGLCNAMIEAGWMEDRGDGYLRLSGIGKYLRPAK